MTVLLQFLVEASPVLSIALKMTLLLLVAWIAHFLLSRSNPRWCVLLWRSVLVGLFLLPAVEFVAPRLSIPVAYDSGASPVGYGPVETLTEESDLPAEEPGTFAVSDNSPAAVPAVLAAPEKSSPEFSLTGWTKKHSTMLLPGICGLVALVLVSRAFASWWLLKNLLRETNPAPGDVHATMLQVAEKIRCSCRARLRLSSKVESPFLAGVIKPVIVLPEGMASEEFSEELFCVLAHELTHLKERDLLWFLAFRCLSIVAWFHPLVWGIRGAHSAACERVCDAVASEYSKGRVEYSRTLARIVLKMIDPPTVTAGIPMIRSSEISHRLQSLKRGIRASSLAVRWVVASVLIGCIVFTGLGALKLVQAEQGTERVSDMPSSSEDDLELKAESAQTQLESESVSDQRSFTEEELKLKSEWVHRLKKMTNHKEMAFGPGKAIRDLEPELALATIREAWPQLEVQGVKTGILKIYQFAHDPLVLKILYLGMTDDDPEVRRYADSYNSEYALQSFLKDESEYLAWYDEFKDQDLDMVVEANYIRLVQWLAKADELASVNEQERVRRISDHARDLGELAKNIQLDRDFVEKRLLPLLTPGNSDELRAAAVTVLGIPANQWAVPELAEMARGFGSDAGGGHRDLDGAVASAIRSISPSFEQIKQHLLPLLAGDCSHSVRSAVYASLGNTKDPEAVDILLDLLVEACSDKSTAFASSIAGVLAEIGDPRAIPTMIGIIDADNSYNTVYGVGYYGLGRLTGVRYSPFHDGAWWSRWWEENKSQFTEEVQAIPIPALPKTEHGKTYEYYPKELETFEGASKFMVERFKQSDLDAVEDAARMLAERKDQKAIPLLIGLIDADNSYDTVYKVGYFALGGLTGVQYSPFHDGAWWRRWWEESKTKFPEEVQVISIPDLPKTEYGKNYTPYPADLTTSFETQVALLDEQIRSGGAKNLGLHELGELMVETHKEKAIPILIGAIVAENTYDTIYGVGYFALRKITGVRYDESHDGEWWLKWWEENKSQFPEDVQKMEIPDFS